MKYKVGDIVKQTRPSCIGQLLIILKHIKDDLYTCKQENNVIQNWSSYWFGEIVQSKQVRSPLPKWW